MALARGNTKSVERLISFGATVNAVDNDGCSPLHYIINRDTMEAPSEESPQTQKVAAYIHCMYVHVHVHGHVCYTHACININSLCKAISRPK